MTARHYIREWRHHKGITQRELAAAVGASVGVIAMIESGQRSYTQGWLERIAPVFGIGPSDLINTDPSEPPPPVSSQDGEGG